MYGWKIATLVLAAGTPALGQDARPSVALGGGTPGPASGPSISSAGGQTAAAWSDLTDGHVYGSSANAVGTVYSAAQGVDDPSTPVPSFTGPSSSSSAGGSAFVLWRDVRTPLEGELFLGNEAGLPISMVDKGHPAGTGRVETFEYECVDADPDPIHHYVILRVDPDPTPGVSGDREVWFARSADGGASFLPPTRLSPPGSQGYGIGLAADGDRVVVAWVDDRFQRHTVFVAVSEDRGATFGPEVGLTKGFCPWPFDDCYIGAIDVDIRGDVIAVAWEQDEAAFFSVQSVVASVSTDAGATFSSPQVAGKIFIFLIEAESPDIEIAPQSGNILVSWADNRSGFNAPYVALSTDHGGLWTETELAPAGDPPRIVVAEAPANDAVAYWTAPGTSADELEARLSLDGGQSWEPAVAVDDNPGDVNAPVAAFDAVYRNFLFAWLADDGGAHAPYAGGFRPQTLSLIHI